MTPSILSRAFGFKSTARNRRQDKTDTNKTAKAPEAQFFANGMEFALTYPR